MTPDVNVLVAAARVDHPHHAVARAWLERSLEGGDAPTLTLLPMVLASALQLLTNPRVFNEPSPIEDVVAFLYAVSSVPGVTVAPLGPEWPKLRRLCLDKSLVGNDVPDAWIAAAVEHLGEHLVSFDRDFRRLLGRSRLTLLDVQRG